ncbi:unnamed protein product [Prorocentrum cordatum]|uniref:Uncharacterized protein n=1 Tax=Prorocentrum cordatum TaxID=2364126 RepID=A0ABN9THU4_9DINO|nr:unnamed protein product [Polarella glacialis]
MVKLEAGVFSPPSEVSGLAEPALMHESGTAREQLREEWGLATVNAVLEGSAFSWPAVVALPRELVASVEDRKPLYTIGDRMRASRARGRRDHTKLWVLGGVDACMLALRRHLGKLEF